MAFLAVLSPLEQTKVSNNNLDLPLPQKMKDELGELLSLKRSINLNNNFWEILLLYSYFFNLAICRLKYETENNTIKYIPTYYMTYSLKICREKKPSITEIMRKTKTLLSSTWFWKQLYLPKWIIKNNPTLLP